MRSASAATSAAWKPARAPPPAPTNLRISGATLTWDAEADLESGLAGFVIERDGKRIATLPEKPKNPFGRPLFQNLLYSDTPSQPLVPLEFKDATARPDAAHSYRVITINTVGLESPPSAVATARRVAESRALLNAAGHSSKQRDDEAIR
jgi:hypothetical protein